MAINGRLPASGGSRVVIPRRHTCRMVTKLRLLISSQVNLKTLMIWYCNIRGNGSGRYFMFSNKTQICWTDICRIYFNLIILFHTLQNRSNFRSITIIDNSPFYNLFTQTSFCLVTYIFLPFFQLLDIISHTSVRSRSYFCLFALLLLCGQLHYDHGMNVQDNRAALRSNWSPCCVYESISHN